MDQHQLSQVVGAEGTVKWFDSRKGFGFVAGPNGADVFVHFSVIDGDGFRMLQEGSLVSYDATLTEKGWKASRVVRRAEAPVPVERGYARSPRR